MPDTTDELVRITDDVLEESARIERLLSMGVPDRCIFCPDGKRGDTRWCQLCIDMEEDDD